MTKFTAEDFKDICNSHGLIVDECVDSHGWTYTVIAHKQGINETITKFVVYDNQINFWINLFPQKMATFVHAPMVKMMPRLMLEMSSIHEKLSLKR